MATVLIQAGVPVMIGVALVCNVVRNMQKVSLRAEELARSSERFKVFSNKE